MTIIYQSWKSYLNEKLMMETFLKHNYIDSRSKWIIWRLLMHYQSINHQWEKGEKPFLKTNIMSKWLIASMINSKINSLETSTWLVSQYYPQLLKNTLHKIWDVSLIAHIFCYYSLFLHGRDWLYFVIQSRMSYTKSKDNTTKSAINKLVNRQFFLVHHKQILIIVSCSLSARLLYFFEWALSLSAECNNVRRNFKVTFLVDEEISKIIAFLCLWRGGWGHQIWKKGIDVTLLKGYYILGSQIPLPFEKNEKQLQRIPVGWSDGS